ncbi:hypothetical protein PHLCEN_2v5408 [Hermanssonia centrifuga]|uniref:Uncharacterized protein n=1 Tax=Hermanssonia centrifuga TaxID=98765 RepID=A0A2R6P5C4_9APHY|nr:hypothetical protein PHLCEN_2v5408 [Hermanssonia centrifuga]
MPLSLSPSFPGAMELDNNKFAIVGFPQPQETGWAGIEEHLGKYDEGEMKVLNDNMHRVLISLKSQMTYNLVPGNLPRWTQVNL